MQLLQTWYNPSDPGVEDFVNDRLLRKFNQQLKKRGIMLKEGKSKVNASLTNTPLSTKGKMQYELAADREEDNRDESDKKKEEQHHKLLEKKKPGVDSEAR